ncbi:MAG: hypothetical protein Q8P05_00405 [Candidatus Diapherotrites archaeon]|nr:hypothetical protein [Candidatus Diapherotrites archaeon]MDZ4256550.1 hypothetical protein [archaeon]
MKEDHTIRLNNAVRIPRTRYANKVVFAVRNYITKHTRAPAKDIRLSPDLNHAIWARGKNVKVPRLEVVLKKKETMVYAFLKGGKDLQEYVAKEQAAAKEAKKAEAKGKKDAKEKPTPKVTLSTETTTKKDAPTKGETAPKTTDEKAPTVPDGKADQSNPPPATPTTAPAEKP